VFAERLQAGLTLPLFPLHAHEANAPTHIKEGSCQSNTTSIPAVAPQSQPWEQQLARAVLDAVVFVRTIDPRDIDRWQRLADAEAQSAHQIDRRELLADADPESPKKRQRTAGPCGTFQQCERLQDNQSLCQRCRHAGLTRCPPHLKWEPRTRKKKEHTMEHQTSGDASSSFLLWQSG